jgi:hypothetical protein
MPSTSGDFVNVLASASRKNGWMGAGFLCSRRGYSVLRSPEARVPVAGDISHRRRAPRKTVVKAKPPN